MPPSVSSYPTSSDSEKKVHQGWGGDEGNTELKDEVAAETDAKAEAGTPTGESWGVEATSADAWAAPADAPTGDVPATEGEKAEGRPRREREPEEEDNTVTLEEYLKQQKEKELEIVPKLEVRKANEGDDSIWKDAVVVSKKDEEETAYFVGKVRIIFFSYFRPSWLTVYHHSPSLPPRFAPRRKRKSSLRSTLASSVRPAAVAEAVAATGAIGPHVEVVVAVAVGVGVPTEETAAHLRWMSMTRLHSRPWPKYHNHHSKLQALLSRLLLLAQLNKYSQCR